MTNAASFVTTALLNRFLDEARGELRILRAATRRGADREEAAAALHRWIGSGGLLGLSDLSRTAAETKTLLRNQTPEDDRRAKDLIARMAAILEGAGESPDKPSKRSSENVSAEKSAAAATPPQPAAEPPAPKRAKPPQKAMAAAVEPETDGLWGVRVALVGLDARSARRCGPALEARGAFPRALDAASEIGRRNLSGFDLFVASSHEENTPPSWRAAIAATHAPVVWVGGRPDGIAELARRTGAVMDFLVSVERPDELVARCEMLISRHSPESSLQPEHPRDAALEIVVADDDPTVNSVLEATLLSEGVLCHCAIDGGEALDLARRIKPDAIVLDVMMPRHDGFEVLAALKNDRETATIPVVMLTARQREEDILRGFSLGADDYIVKPFSPNEVLVRLRRLVRKNRFNARAAAG